MPFEVTARLVGRAVGVARAVRIARDRLHAPAALAPVEPADHGNRRMDEVQAVVAAGIDEAVAARADEDPRPPRGAVGQTGAAARDEPEPAVGRDAHDLIVGPLAPRGQEYRSVRSRGHRAARQPAGLTRGTLHEHRSRGAVAGEPIDLPGRGRGIEPQ